MVTTFTLHYQGEDDQQTDQVMLNNRKIIKNKLNKYLKVKAVSELNH